MPKSTMQYLLHNLSAQKYEYNSIFNTALSQLDHMFCTVGNGVDYDSNRGLYHSDDAGKNGYYLAEKHDVDLEKIQALRERRREHLLQEYKRWETIFPENVPAEISEQLNVDLAELKAPFEVMSEIYYFSFIRMAREMVEHVRQRGISDPHSRLAICTPYPLSIENSNICKMTQHDNPLMVQLAIAMSKAWVEVLNYYIYSEWYYTEEEVEKYGGASYYYSLAYINKSIDDFKRIIKHLEIHHD